MTDARELFAACRRCGLPLICALRVTILTTWKQRRRTP